MDKLLELHKPKFKAQQFISISVRERFRIQNTAMRITSNPTRYSFPNPKQSHKHNQSVAAFFKSGGVVAGVASLEVPAESVEALCGAGGLFGSFGLEEPGIPNGLPPPKCPKCPCIWWPIIGWNPCMPIGRPGWFWNHIKFELVEEGVEAELGESFC